MTAHEEPCNIRVKTRTNRPGTAIKKRLIFGRDDEYYVEFDDSRKLWVKTDSLTFLERAE
jgi:hypothetical protein